MAVGPVPVASAAANVWHQGQPPIKAACPEMQTKKEAPLPVAVASNIRRCAAGADCNWDEIMAGKFKSKC